MALLGSMMVAADTIDAVVPLVCPEAFYLPAHGRLYSVLVKLHESGKPIDLLVATDELRRTGDLDYVGGQDYMIQLAESFGEPSNAEGYATIVREKFRLRECIRAGGELQNKSYELDADPDALAGRCIDRLDRLAQPIGDFASRDILDHLDGYREYATDAPKRFVPSGLDPIDTTLSGLALGATTIIAGRTSIGKTSLAMTLAVNAARLSNGVPVLFFSLEQPLWEIMNRVVSQIGGISAHDVLNGLMRRDMLDRAIGDVRTLQARGRLFIEADAFVVSDILAIARSHVRRYGVKLIVIDYLQLVDPSERAESRNLAVASVSRALKRLAMRTGAAVLVLSQLSREAVKMNRPPKLCDLRDSGAIEQDADSAWLLHCRSDEEDRSVPLQPMELNVAKNRNGPTPIFRLAFHRPTMRFIPLQAEEKAPPVGTPNLTCVGEEVTA